MVVTSKERAISTVRSVEPSLTTMISSISALFVRTLRTSAIVFSSLYAAMMAEMPNATLLSSLVGVQPADHTTAICAVSAPGGSSQASPLHRMPLR